MTSALMICTSEDDRCVIEGCTLPRAEHEHIRSHTFANAKQLARRDVVDPLKRLVIVEKKPEPEPRKRMSVPENAPLCILCERPKTSHRGRIGHAFLTQANELPKDFGVIREVPKKKPAKASRRETVIALVHEIEDLRAQIETLEGQLSEKEAELEDILG